MNVTGPLQSRYGLNLSLKKIKVPTGLHNNRDHLRRRGLVSKEIFDYFSTVPLSLPGVYKWYHFGVLKDIEVFARPDLAILVTHTSILQDLRDGSGNKLFISKFVNTIHQRPVFLRNGDGLPRGNPHPWLFPGYLQAWCSNPPQ